MRRLVLASIIVLAGLLPAAGAGAPSAQTMSRILYAGDWTGPTEIMAVDPSGRAPLGQVTFGREAACVDDVLACGFDDPVPSPDGRYVLFRAAKGPEQFPAPSLWVAHANGSGERRLAQSVSANYPAGAAWSPDSTRIAYCAPDGVHVVRVDGTGDRLTVAGRNFSDVAWAPDGKSLEPSDGGELAWSPDGRWIATWSTNGLGRLSVKAAPRARAARPFPAINVQGVFAVAWSPDSRLIALEGFHGLSVVDARTGRIRLLTRDTAHETTQPNYGQAARGLAWSPDGRSIAYVNGYFQYGLPVGAGDLRTVTLSGHVHTVVSASRAYGGRIVSLAWTRPTAKTRYRSPRPTPSSVIGSDSLLAAGPVYRLVADGGSVAYLACHGVYAWTPGSKSVATVETSQYGCLPPSEREKITDVALAGDRVAWAQKTAGLGFRWTVSMSGIASGAAITTLATGYGDLGDPPLEGVGTLVGAGSLLVDSSWTYSYSRRVATSQTVNRIDATGCPCPALATSPGPLTPFDVESGRVVAGGDNETLVIDGHGTTVVSVPVSPVAAQLSGNDLILLRQGELLEYDATTGALIQRIQLPDVPSGRDCDFYDDPACSFRAPSLRLEDAARGLVTYVLDGQVHLLRLSNGADAVVAAGTLARFMDAGLVYADGSRLHLVPYDQLPLQ